MNSLLSSSLLNADEEEAVDALRQLISYQPSLSPFPASFWCAPSISCGGVGEWGSVGEEETNQRKQHATEELIKNPIATSTTTTTTTSINDSRESSSNEISSAENLRGLHHIDNSITSKSCTTTTMRTTTTTTTATATKNKGESGLNETKRLKLPQPPPPSLAAEKPTMITCECGAVIRRRTVWKHSLTRKHISFMEQRMYRPTYPHQRSTSSAVSSFSSSRTPLPLTGPPIPPLSQPQLLSSYLIAGWAPPTPQGLCYYLPLPIHTSLSTELWMWSPSQDLQPNWVSRTNNWMIALENKVLVIYFFSSCALW